MVDRKATSVWQGDLSSGFGEATLDSSGLGGPLAVSWPARAELDDPGGRTSPEELIAAAHSSCYNMALSNMLAKAGHTPKRIATRATVSFSTDGGAHIAGVALHVRATVPGLSDEEFAEHAEGAKDGCPVSKALAGNVPVTLDAALG